MASTLDSGTVAGAPPAIPGIGTPVSPSDLVSSPIPGAAGYAQADTNAMNAYNNALALINQKRLSTLQQFGYTGSVDPTTGTISGVSVNPNDPYGSLQQLLRSSALQEQADQQAAQERGLRGGLANQAISQDKYNFGDQSQQLGTSLENQLEDLQRQQSDAAYTRDSALYQAEQQAAQDAITNQAFDTPSYSDVQLPAYGNTGNFPQTRVKGGKVVPPPKGSSTAARRQKIIQQQAARSRALNKRRPRG